MTTVVLAWGAALGVCAGAVLFGQTARGAPRHAGARRPARRAGLLLSLSGPWLALAAAVALGAATGDWLTAAAAAAAGGTAVAVAGLVLTPR